MTLCRQWKAVWINNNWNEFIIIVVLNARNDNIYLFICWWFFERMRARAHTQNCWYFAQRRDKNDMRLNDQTLQSILIITIIRLTERSHWTLKLNGRRMRWWKEIKRERTTNVCTHGSTAQHRMNRQRRRTSTELWTLFSGWPVCSICICMIFWGNLLERTIYNIHIHTHTHIQLLERQQSEKWYAILLNLWNMKCTNASWFIEKKKKKNCAVFMNDE